MKILIVSQYFYPESFRINDIALEWVNRGHEVSVVTGIPNYPEGKFYKNFSLFQKRKEVYKGITICRLPIIPRGSSKIGIILNYLSFMISGLIWANTTHVKPDIIFSFETSPMTQLLVGTRLAKRTKNHHILYVQDLWPENVVEIGGIHTPFIIKPLDSMVKYIYRHADLILATSPSFVEMIKTRIQTDKKNKSPLSEMKVVFWPQYAEDFYKPVRSNKKNIGLDVFKVVFTGNIGYAQGLEILPACADHLSERGYRDRVRFIIVGDGRAKKDLQRKVSEYGLSEMFEFSGRKKPEEIPEILSECDVAFLSFANNKLFAATIPAKLQSYMACAMPIVAVAVGETERIIKEAECGLCSAPGDSHALATSIEKIMNMDQSEIDSMSTRSLSYYSTYFDKKKLMDRMERYLISIK